MIPDPYRKPGVVLLLIVPVLVRWGADQASLVKNTPSQKKKNCEPEGQGLRLFTGLLWYTDGRAHTKHSRNVTSSWQVSLSGSLLWPVLASGLLYCVHSGSLGPQLL